MSPKLAAGSSKTEEEGECCPFFVFDQWEEGDEVVLRIVRPEGNTE